MLDEQSRSFLDNDVVSKWKEKQNMRAKTYLSVKPSGGSATIYVHTTTPAYFVFIGASCTASARAMSGVAISQGLTSVTIAPEKGKPGVVALELICPGSKGRRETSECLFIPFQWEGDRLIVDLETPFVSHPARLGQLTEDGDLVISTSGHEFVSPKPSYMGGDWAAKKRAAFIGKGYRIVDDANLLCRFLVGEATLEDLEASATQDERTLTHRALGKCMMELENTKTKLAKSKENAKWWEGEHGSMLKEAEKADREKREAHSTAKLEEWNRAEKLSINLGFVARNKHDQGTLFGFLAASKYRKARRLTRAFLDEVFKRTNTFGS